MAVTVTASFPPLAGLALSTKGLMREIGLLARERIYRRTIASRDQYDVPFKDYSTSYAKAKAKEVGEGPVNLQLSGAMLNAMTIRSVTEDTVEIGFSS
jgi:hypothetical protein